MSSRPGWHARSREDALAELDADVAGLTSEQAGERLRRYGANRLPEERGPSAWELLARQVASPLMYALILSALLAMALGEFEDGVVVLAVVVLNSLIGFAQEYRAGRAIAALAGLVADPARVRRDGTWIEVPAEQVVPGDVVAVAQGDRVTADLRLLRAEGLRAQEAALTGESVPVRSAPRRRRPTRRWPSATACCTPARWWRPAPGAASPSPPAARPSSGASPTCSRRSTRCALR